MNVQLHMNFVKLIEIKNEIEHKRKTLTFLEEQVLCNITYKRTNFSKVTRLSYNLQSQI